MVAIAIIAGISLTSCSASMWEGVAMGLSGMPGYSSGSYGSYGNTNYSSSSYATSSTSSSSSGTTCRGCMVLAIVRDVEASAMCMTTVQQV